MADKNGSSTAWATVLYPDSMPSNVWDILEHFYIPIAVSPLHDSDLKDDGSLDKPHYHVLFTFGKSKKSPSQFDEMRALIGGVGKECVMSAKGYARYLCHLDSPNKHQYSISDVQCFGGFDYDSIIETSGSVTQTLAHIIKWCNMNGVNIYIPSRLRTFHESETKPKLYSSCNHVQFQIAEIKP